MAITITKNISGVYPAYNDSYIQFTSSLANNERAEIEITGGIFTERFIVYPNKSGVYTFNFKEPAKALMSEYPLEDVNGATISSGTWGQSLNGVSLTLDATIYVYNSTTNESTTINLDFYRAVKQYGQSIYDNNGQILNYSTNGVDFNLTYFEGYPFSFELQNMVHTGTKDITVKNLNTGNVSEEISTQFTGAFKIIVDKGSFNWTTTDFLPLPSTINRLEIYEDEVFKSNLNLKKVSSKCGVYLKWLNNDGGYSYWLFDEFYRDTLTSNIVGVYATNAFGNIGDSLSPSGMLGKEAARSMRLKTKVNKTEVKIIESLFTSPYVELYSATEPFQDGTWLSVQLNDNFTISNKKEINDVTVNIVLPEQNTITR